MDGRSLFAGGAIGFVLGAGLAFLLAIFALPNEEDAVLTSLTGGEPGTSVPEKAGPQGAPEGNGRTEGARDGEGEAADPGGGRGAASRSEVERLRRENERLRERLGTVEAKGAPEDAAAPRVARAFRFGVPEKASVFDEADWKNLGGHMTKLAGLLPSLAEEIVKDRRPSDRTMAEVQKHNSPLAAFTLAAASELGGSGPNGAYTHPAVMANLVRASLEAGGEPLTGSQEQSIRALGAAWAAERARASEEAGTNRPLLAGTVEEVDAKLRFLRSVKNVLTPRQRDILFHPDIEGRAQMDLLSPALVYVMRQPVPGRSRAELEKGLVEALGSVAGADEGVDAAPYAWVARQWVDDVPRNLQPIRRGSLDHLFPRVETIQEAARAQVAAIERIAAMGRLTPDQVDSLLAVRTVLMPIIWQEEEED